MLSETLLFDVRLTAGDIPSAVEAVLRKAKDGDGSLVCAANVDMLTRAKRDKRLRTIMQQAAIVVTDGAPLVWALRKKGVQCSRVYGPDLMRALCIRFAAEEVPIFLYGGSTAQDLQRLISQIYLLAPQIRIAGAVCPPQLPTEPTLDTHIIETIKNSGAKAVFVGLGCPKQEYWMQVHAPHIPAVSLGVGLAFAQIAGLKSTAPSWMQQRGLEWLFRLIQEPRRLWKRYLLGNSLFVWYVAQEFYPFSLWRRR